MKNTYYALLWRSRNKRDGPKEHLIREEGVPMLFRKRADAERERRRYRSMCWLRKDLRAEPRGWLMPRVVKVAAQIVDAGRMA